MYNWFECKVKYEKDLGEGKTKKVIEPYLVDALSFTEAEHRIISEIQPFMSGEFQVSDIKRVNIAELFETNEESADKWYQCKLAFITLDEKSGTEKRTTQSVMVQAAGLREAVTPSFFPRSPFTIALLTRPVSVARNAYTRYATTTIEIR